MGKVGRVLSVGNSCFKEKLEKQRISTGDVVSNLLIEAGLVLLLFLLILVSNSITLPQSLVIIVSLIVLSLILITDNCGLLQTSLGQIGLAFIFMFVFSIVSMKDLKLFIMKDKMLVIPLAMIFLFVSTMAWIVKNFMKGKLELLRIKVIVPFLCAAGLLSFIAIGLHVTLSVIYQIDPRNLAEILKQLFQHTILFMIVVTNVRTRQKAKRMSFYIMGTFILLLILKGISLF